uniref:Uncharacterized protein n=1 Tax=Leersia perrieri TaxID=77586 RepID=A0A0D9WUY8_9ORYZ
MAAMMMRSALARRLAGSAMKEIPSFRSAVPPATGRIPNLQGLQHFNVISRGTEGMKQANQMRYVSTGSNCEADINYARLAK